MNSPERNVFFQAARSGRAGPPRSVFSHPDCTVGTGIAPVQLALADFLLTAGRGSHPALKTFYSVADSQYSTFFVKCNRFFRISAVVFGETIQSRCRRRRPRRPRRGQRGASETVGRMRSHLPCRGRRPDAPAETPRFLIIRRANPQTLACREGASPLPAVDAPTNADVGRMRKHEADSPYLVLCCGWCCTEGASLFPTTGVGADSPGVGSCFWRVLRGKGKPFPPMERRSDFDSTTPCGDKACPFLKVRCYLFLLPLSPAHPTIPSSISSKQPYMCIAA